MVQRCCICKTWTSKRFTDSRNYEALFVDCFGQLAKGRSGKICHSSRNNLNEHTFDRSKTYFQKVDQREQKNKTKKQERSEKARANIYARNNPIFILELPHDVWIQILLFLKPKDITSFGQASSETYSLSNDYTLWKDLYLKSFGRIQKLTLTED